MASQLHTTLQHYIRAKVTLTGLSLVYRSTAMLALLCVWRILMDHWIAPRVMGRKVRVHPLLAIFTFMLAGGIVGI